ncbi:hypothetical protein L3X38_035829 [Prunus dulcis]|uniref:Uncharacterized protein n=1 Tax=Prunus dulcis TaxID=3755 RepID=A0AAD4YZ76_PRUDU|nr:hypothetical protein L3X38_035829 [Prunus dulcis]
MDAVNERNQREENKIANEIGECYPIMSISNVKEMTAIIKLRKSKKWRGSVSIIAEVTADEREKIRKLAKASNIGIINDNEASGSGKGEGGSKSGSGQGDGGSENGSEAPQGGKGGGGGGGGTKTRCYGLFTCFGF